MMETARPADPGDVAAIEHVAQLVRAEQVDARGGALFQAREAGPWPLGDRVRDLIDRADSVAVVGCYDDVVFGYGLATIEQLPDGRSLGRLDDLAVEPEARGSGIGEAMMNLMLSELRAAGCRGVDSRALPGDRQTKNFFESFGLKARLLVVHQTFDDEATA